MNVMKRWPQTCALILALMLVLAGCRSASGSVAFASLSAGAAPSPSDRSDIVNALKAAREDLKVIDDLIADGDLGLLEEDNADTAELTEEDVAAYMEALDKHKGKIQAALTEMMARPELKNEDMSDFRTAEIAQFELAGDVVEEFMQVLHYIQSLLDLADQMDAIGQVDAADPAGMYEAISQTIDEAIKDLKSNEVPTFLKSMNDNMITSLGEMNDAVLYSLVAEEISDPIRRNGAAYRMGILERKFERISVDAQTDTEERMQKLRDDIKKIQQVNEGLSRWVQDNLDRLAN